MISRLWRLQLRNLKKYIYLFVKHAYMYLQIACKKKS